MLLSTLAGARAPHPLHVVRVMKLADVPRLPHPHGRAVAPSAPLALMCAAQSTAQTASAKWRTSRLRRKSKKPQITVCVHVADQNWYFEISAHAWMEWSNVILSVKQALGKQRSTTCSWMESHQKPHTLWEIWQKAETPLMSKLKQRIVLGWKPGN